MIEYFPEPEELKAVGECVECERNLYKGNKVVYIHDEFLCKDCWGKAALEDSTKGEFKEYLKESDLSDGFAEWFYEQHFKIL